MIGFGLLEMHVANACNLTCDSCAHFSNNGHKGIVGVGEADAWMKAWNRRLRPDGFRLLGGEPTLNPQLADLIYLARENWPHSQILLTTNGFFLHRHARLAEALSKTDAHVLLTVHHASPEYLAKAREILALLHSWRAVYPFFLAVEESWRRWTRRYRGFGPDVLPFDDRDPRSSWANCAARTCRQLFRGRLWKCSPLAYLQLQKEAHPTMSPVWDPYLAYEPLAPTCSEDELEAFFLRREEDVCAMCPAAPEPFEKASPLIPLGEVMRRRRA